MKKNFKVFLFVLNLCVLFCFCKNSHNSSCFPIFASFAMWLYSSFHQGVDFIFSHPSSGLFGWFSSPKSRSQEVCTLLRILLEPCHHHVNKPGQACWSTGAHTEQSSAIPDEASLDWPTTRWHSNMWANPAAINWVTTQPTAETRRHTHRLVSKHKCLWLEAADFWVVCFTRISN